MAPFLFSIFDFVAKHKWVQWILGIIAIVLTVGLYLVWRDNGVRQKERRRAQLDTIQTINKIEKEARADADAAIEARDTAPHYGSADGVPDTVADRIFNN